MANFAPLQHLVVCLAPLFAVGIFRRGLLQRADVPGTAHIDSAQRDTGRCKRARVDAADRYVFFQAAHFAPAAYRFFAVHRWRDSGVVARGAGTPGTNPVCGGRLLYSAGQYCLGVLQLASG